jgi:Zn-dependent protease/CBS domain-containing protein
VKQTQHGALEFARVGGIPLQIHYTWLVALALITWSLAAGFLPSTYPGWTTGTYWLAGFIAALCLFGSVLIHEGSHAIVARSRGLDVHAITLFIFGGVSQIKEEAERPGDEFAIAIVGPLTSFGLAAVFWGTGTAIDAGRTPLGAILAYLTFINVLLGAFNLVPGFPLDGGRVLRSIIWGITGSLKRATEIASYVGQAVGFGLMLLGGVQIFAGNIFGGVWIALIGWFLNNGAEGSRRQLLVNESLQGIRVSYLMNPRPPSIQPEATVHEFVLGHVLREGTRAMPVIESGRLLGIVSVSDVKELPPERWITTPVRAIMTRTPLHVVGPEADAVDALQMLVSTNVNQLPVVDDITGLVVGLLGRADVLHLVQLREELGVEKLPTSLRRTETAEGSRAA